MKTKSEELNLIWDELQDIFLKYERLTSNNVLRLRKLGYRVVLNAHPKLYIKVHNTIHIITISSTPSDKYAGRQILREIRRIYEQYR